MSLSRRGLFKLAAGASLFARWTDARELMRRGGVGRVVFCRVSHRSTEDAVAWLRFIFDGAMPLARRGPALRYPAFVAAFQRGTGRMVICGTEATLVLDSRGCRRFA